METNPYKIHEEDMEGKGVSAQSNPMEKPEEEAKAVFDELVKVVVVPKFNAFVEIFKNVDLTSDLDKPISTEVQKALDLKVDKEKRTGSETAYKVLSDNNYDDTEKETVRQNKEARHGHENKETLDDISNEDVASWRAKPTQQELAQKVSREKRTGSETVEKVLSDNNYDDTEKETVKKNKEARHGHENKELLDNLTQKDIDNWNGGNVLTLDNEKPFTPTGPYHPATQKYVDDKVVNIGAADMTAAVYDPTGRRKDIFAEIDKVAKEVGAALEEMTGQVEDAVEASKYIIDDVTGEKYILGVRNGGLYYKKAEVTE